MNSGDANIGAIPFLGIGVQFPSPHTKTTAE